MIRIQDLKHSRPLPAGALRTKARLFGTDTLTAEDAFGNINVNTSSAPLLEFWCAVIEEPFFNEQLSGRQLNENEIVIICKKSEVVNATYQIQIQDYIALDNSEGFGDQTYRVVSFYEKPYRWGMVITISSVI